MYKLSTSSILRISDEKTMQLIDLYRKEECLWNTTSEDYKNKVKRLESVNRIANILGIPNFGGRHVLMKFKNLRNSYSQELKKIAQAKNTGKYVYRPTVFWFEKMNSFIRPHLQKPRGVTTFSTFIKNDLDSYVKYKLVGGLLKGAVPHKVDCQSEPVEKPERPLKKLKPAVLATGISKDIASTSKVTEDCVENDIDPLGEATICEDRTEEYLQVTKPGEVLMVKMEPLESENDSHVLKRRSSQNSPASSYKRSRMNSDSDEQNTLNTDEKSQEDQKAIINCLKDLSKNLNVLMSPNEDYFDNFGKYIAGLLRSLPQEKALELQPQIISLITAAGLANFATQDDNNSEMETVIKFEK